MQPLWTSCTSSCWDGGLPTLRWDRLQGCADAARRRDAGRHDLSRINSSRASSRHAQTYGANERATSMRNVSAAVLHNMISALPNTVRVHMPMGNAE